MGTLYHAIPLLNKNLTAITMKLILTCDTHDTAAYSTLLCMVPMSSVHISIKLCHWPLYTHKCTAAAAYAANWRGEEGRGGGGRGEGSSQLPYGHLNINCQCDPHSPPWSSVCVCVCVIGMKHIRSKMEKKVDQACKVCFIRLNSPQSSLQSVSRQSSFFC